MGDRLKGKLEQFMDFETEFIEQTEEDKKLNLPPVIKGRSHHDDPNNIYGHHHE